MLTVLSADTQKWFDQNQISRSTNPISGAKAASKRAFTSRKKICCGIASSAGMGAAPSGFGSASATFRADVSATFSSAAHSVAPPIVTIVPPARTHVTITPTSGLERAQVKWFNRLRGFGFLTRGEGTPDIFVHMETLRRFGITELRPGQTVLVRFGPGPKGLMAAEVRPDGGPHGPASH